MAKRKGQTLDEFAETLFRAAVDSERLSPREDFMEAWKKFLLKQLSKKT